MHFCKFVCRIKPMILAALATFVVDNPCVTAGRGAVLALPRSPRHGVLRRTRAAEAHGRRRTRTPPSSRRGGRWAGPRRPLGAAGVLNGGGVEEDAAAVRAGRRW